MPFSPSFRHAAALAAALALAAAACDGGSRAPTQPEPEPVDPGDPAHPAVIPARLVIVGDSQSAVVATELPAAVVARVLDASGRPIPDRWVYFRRLNFTDSLSADSARTDTAGEARVRWRFGSYASTRGLEVRAPVGFKRPPLADTVVATGLPGPPASLTASGESYTVNGAMWLSVSVYDRFRNRIPGLDATWTVLEGGGSLGPPSGSASARWTLGPSGMQRVRASYGPFADTVSFVVASADRFRIAALANDPGSTVEAGILLLDPATGEWHWRREPLNYSFDKIDLHALSWAPGGEKFAYVETVFRWDNESSFEWVETRVGALGTDFGMQCRCGLRDLAWSPDATRVAATLGNSIGVTRSEGNGHYHQVLATGVAPQWSPDGERIFFLAGNEIRSIRADGTGAVTHLRGVSESSRKWLSPDGLRLAYTPQNESEVYVSALDGSGAVRVSTGCGCVALGWLPDGRTLLTAQGGLGPQRWLRVAADGSGTTQVAVPLGSQFQDASPDGSILLFRRGDNELLLAHADGRVVTVPSTPEHPLPRDLSNLQWFRPR